MSKMRPRLSGALAAAAVASALAPVPALAAVPTVVYHGADAAASLEGAPGGDMFHTFRDLMPGDVAEQSVSVRNDSDVPVDVYARAAYAGPLDGLEEVRLTVSDDGGVVAAGLLADHHGMLRPVKLCTLDAGGEWDADVRLDIPVEVGNETMGAVQDLSWTFTFEERGAPARPGFPGGWLPQTGDAAAALVLVLGAAGSVLIVIGILRRRRGGAADC